MTALTWNGLDLEAYCESDAGSWTEEPWESLEITEARLEDPADFYDAFYEAGLDAVAPGWSWGADGSVELPPGFDPKLSPSDVASLLSDDQRRDLMEQVR